jgi:CheY-like chemotaxis protein
VPKILVADDNANIQKMVVLSFEDRGIQVVTVGNGEAAVRRIPELKPDLVLADIFMPVRNGYEVCEFVKKDERFSHVPVILLVGAFDPLDEKEARRVGADGVLKKPFVPPDPLIAMVMSALEKNPKIAAELAKAREAKEAPPVVEEVVAPVPPPSTSARSELKPLPSFPEPESLEEQALAYGFTTTKRAIDDGPAETEAAELKGPQAPKAAESEDEFDTASTARDWRRDAMDLDIPADAANRPAFVDHDLEPAMFPSERDVPPKHVRMEEPAEEPASFLQAPAPAPVAELKEEKRETEAPVATTEEQPSNFFADEPTVIAKAEVIEAMPVELEPIAPVSAAPTSRPYFATTESTPEAAPSASTHWMDQLAQGSDRSPSDWMSVLSEQTKSDLPTAAPELPSPSTGASATPASESFEPSRNEAPSEQTAGSSSKWEQNAKPVEQDSWFSSPKSESSAQESWLTPKQSEPETQETSAGEARGESFFAEEPTPGPTIVSSEATQSTATTASASTDSWFSTPVSEPESTVEPLHETFSRSIETTSVESVPVAASTIDEGFEKDSDFSAPIAFKDPNLVESPAVHVTPEPLLVDEETHGPSDYNLAPREEMEPLHSFRTPAAIDPVAHCTASEDGQPFASFAPPIPEAEPEGFSERIPTGPPPNREALAEIPFLTPPPDFHAQETEQEQAGANPETVDAVVRKVLEKLEPQLHDLLSQGVLKPLVENLLQNELTKKEK